MSAYPSTATRWIRSAALLLGAWIAFFLFQGLVSVALSPRRPTNPTGLVQIQLTLGVLWAGMSVGVALWHRRVRTFAHHLFALIAAHLPMLIAVVLIDGVVSRAAIRAFTHQQQLMSFWAMLVLFADLNANGSKHHLDARGSIISRLSFSRISSSTHSARSPSWRTTRQPRHTA
jgi:hypothetical protein